MGLLRYLKNKKACFKEGHLWEYEGPTLGGDWIRCTRCRAIEEYLPGAHEPKGYEYTAAHQKIAKELDLY